MRTFYTDFLLYSNLYYLDPQKAFNEEELFDYSILSKSKRKLNNFQVSFLVNEVKKFSINRCNYKFSIN